MLLEIEDLVKVYPGGKRANDGITIGIDAGEVYGLLGPNGAGKTTLVHQVVGLMKPTSGSIHIEDVDVVAHPAEAKRRCAWQSQKQLAITALTPRQAIGLSGELRGGSRKAVTPRTERLIDALQLEEWADKRMSTVSGGVSRLVTFCMAAVWPSRLAVLDEPTNDVDPVRRKILWNLVRAMADDGAAILLVTHNVLEAERAVDRLAILDQGQVLAEGRPGSLNPDPTQLRLEFALRGEVRELDLPPFMAQPVQSGRRLTTHVDAADVTEAVLCAQHFQSVGLVDEFSIGPLTLEDTYMRVANRAGELAHD